MAKMIKYKFLCSEVNRGTEENPDIEKILLDVVMGWNEANEEIAKREADNGEYTIVENGELETVISVEDRLTELEAALTLLLEGATE